MKGSTGNKGYIIHVEINHITKYILIELSETLNRVSRHNTLKNLSTRVLCFSLSLSLSLSLSHTSQSGGNCNTLEKTPNKYFLGVPCDPHVGIKQTYIWNHLYNISFIKLILGETVDFKNLKINEFLKAGTLFLSAYKKFLDI